MTALERPSFVTDVAGIPGSTWAVLAVSGIASDGTNFGSDLWTLDTMSGQSSALITRSVPTESLGAPAWLPGSTQVLFQREDHSVAGRARPGAATLSYPSRIEVATTDGAARSVVIDDGGSPAPSTDGTQIAYLRSSEAGIALLVRSVSSGTDRTLVAEGQFPDLGYPRYSPRGDRIAFMAPTQSANGPGLVIAQLLGVPTPVFAHGFLFDVCSSIQTAPGCADWRKQVRMTAR
jgi:Tol biopolymer transport system component